MNAPIVPPNPQPITPQGRAGTDPIITVAKSSNPVAHAGIGGLLRGNVVLPATAKCPYCGK